MPLIRVREKNQITLPREIVDFFHLKTPTHIEYKIMPDGVLIRPAKASAVNASDKMARLLRLSTKKSAYGAGSAGEVDAFINANRNE